MAKEYGASTRQRRVSQIPFLCPPTIWPPSPLGHVLLDGGQFAIGVTDSQSNSALRELILVQTEHSGRTLVRPGSGGAPKQVLFKWVLPMSLSDYPRSAPDRRQRRLLIVLASGLVIFGAAAAALFYILQPEPLRIAVGPDYEVVQAMAEVFGDESRTIRLSPITTEGAAESLALPGAGKADLEDRSLSKDKIVLLIQGPVSPGPFLCS